MRQNLTHAFYLEFLGTDYSNYFCLYPENRYIRILRRENKGGDERNDDLKSQSEARIWIY